MHNKIQDASIRQQALDISKSFIVQAPAGSGKTELLTQRYLKLLAHAHKAPEEIIAITFTRKAASEMRGRIIAAFQFAQQQEPDKNDYRHTTWHLAKNALNKNAELGWDILQNPNRLRILTIDSLSALLCRQTPLLSQMGNAYAITENANELYELAAQKLLIDISQDNIWQLQLEQLLLHLDNRTTSLKTLLANLLSHRDQWLPVIIQCKQHHAILKSSLEKSLTNIALEMLHMAAASIPPSLRQQLVLLARHAGNYFKENDNKHAIAACADFTWNEKPTISSMNSWKGLSKLLLTEKNWRKRIDIRQGFHAKDEQKPLMMSLLAELSMHHTVKKCLIDIAHCPSPTISNTQWETLQSLLQLLPLLSAELQLIFQEKGLVDFLEFNLKALTALGESDAPTDLALYLDYQICHLLIDEFQDTSLTHFHLLQKIIAGWEQQDGRTLFLVGDPMQSIYRFRNAEVGLFLRAQQQGIGNVTLTPLTLSMNFRSQKNLVEWYNNTFSRLFPAVPDIATGSVPYTASLPAKTSLDNDQVQFYPVINGTNNDEAREVVEKIKSCHCETPTDSIAILVRSRNQLNAIIAELHQQQLSFQAVDIESLAEKTVIQDLLTLTRALLHRANRIAWLSLLRSPWCGLQLNDLEIISTHANNTTIWQSIIHATQLSVDGIERLTKLRNILRHAFTTQSQLSLTLWIKGVWLALGGPACLATKLDLEHANAFFHLLEQCENQDPIITIEQLNKRLLSLFANTKNNALIHIMTMHKSKGLEFDHVFLPGLHKKSRVDDSPLFRFMKRPNIFGGDDFVIAPIKAASQDHDPIDAFLKETENNKQNLEATRILYVAATRAKKSLSLFAQVTVDEKKAEILAPPSGSFLEKCWPILEASIQTKHIISNAENDTKITVPKNKLFRLSNNWEIPIPLSLLTASTHEVPAYISLDDYQAVSAIIGTAIHELLQHLAENPSQYHFSVEKWQARLFSLGLLPHDMQEGIALMKTALHTITHDERGRWILSNQHDDAHSEWSLTFFDRNEIHHHTIDRTFIDANNVRWIIDYKTATPKPTESIEYFLERQKLEHKNQLEKYGAIYAAMANHPIAFGLYFPLCAGWVEWIYCAEKQEATLMR